MNKERTKIIATNIKNLIIKNGITQKELSKAIGISPSTMSDYMNLRSNPSHGVIQKIADYFGVLKSDIDTTYKVGQTSDLLTIYNQLTPPRQTKVYDFAEYQLDEQNNNQSLNEESVIYLRSSNQSAAGMMIDPDNPEEFDVLPSEMVPRGADEIVEIMGESMEPLIKKGERVFLRHQPTVENGEIAIVRIEDEGVTCKRFYLKGDTVILKSENERYKDMTFDPSQVTVLGKVLK